MLVITNMFAGYEGSQAWHRKKMSRRETPSLRSPSDRRSSSAFAVGALRDVAEKKKKEDPRSAELMTFVAPRKTRHLAPVLRAVRRTTAAVLEPMWNQPRYGAASFLYTDATAESSSKP